MVGTVIAAIIGLFWLFVIAYVLRKGWKAAG